MCRRYAPVIAAARTAWRHSPPGIARGALFCGLIAAQALRHLFENLALVAREALDALLRDLVEHAIELVGACFAASRRRRQRYGSLRRNRLALGDDVVHFVAAFTPRQVPGDGARRLIRVGNVGHALTNLVDTGGGGHTHIDVSRDDPAQVREVHHVHTATGTG